MPGPLARLAAYRAHPDPRAAAANTLALVLAGNGPVYPIYVWLLVGRAAWPALVALWAAPCYAAVPHLMRRDARAARVLLVAVSVVNTSLFVLLFGPGAQLQLFLLPCIALGLLFPPAERWLGYALSGLPLVVFAFLRGDPHAPVLPFTAAQSHALATLNQLSAATLTWFMTALFAAMATALGDARGTAALHATGSQDATP